MVIEVDFYEKDTHRFRSVRLSVIDNGEPSVLAVLKKYGEKVLKIKKITVVDPSGKRSAPTLPSNQQPTEAPIESSDDSNGTISLFQPLEI